MEVILLENIASLGELGEKVQVRSGYGRNFLIPKKKALRANEENKEYNSDSVFAKLQELKKD